MGYYVKSLVYFIKHEMLGDLKINISIVIGDTSAKNVQTLLSMKQPFKKLRSGYLQTKWNPAKVNLQINYTARKTYINQTT